jgi:hypothetical protein
MVQTAGTQRGDHESLTKADILSTCLRAGDIVGQLFYGNDSQPAELPDRVLAHVKALAATKLRRGESFTLSWRHSDGVPGGRSTLWLNPSIPLRFVFTSAEGEMLDQDILKRLANDASSSSGLTIRFEDFEDTTASIRQLSPRLSVVA